MRQVAPYPVVLDELVQAIGYKRDWAFALVDEDRGQGSAGLTLSILIETPDAYHPGRTRRVMHYMPVPPAAYGRSSWQRWLLEQILLVEQHEACEFFRLEYDTPNRVGTEILGTNHHVERPFAPNHGPGHDPYVIVQLTTDEDRRTAYTGAVKPA